MPQAPFNPFPGLRPFEAEEDYLFFGREKQIDELLRRLRTTRFLSVIGTSGSGKSSLVRAGLIPALQGGFMAVAGSCWRIATFRPAGDPIGNLAAALSDPAVLGTDPELAGTQRVLIEATLRRGTLGLANAVRQAAIPANDNLLIVVDQFEELFRFRHSRQADSKDEALAFVKLLLEAVRQNVPLYVVLTMRSDFIGDCMEYSGLPEAINAGQYLVPRMTRDELRLAITGPVAVGGGQIATRLVLRLLNDVGDDQDQLPVLQHALMRTWDEWQTRAAGENPAPGRIEAGIGYPPVDLADYEAAGTMQNALNLHAEQAYEETAAQGIQKVTQHLFKAVTDTYSDPRGIRRPTSIGNLVAITGASEAQLVAIVEIFRKPGRSFLMPPPDVALTPDAIIDISHESLMRCWSRLMNWAEEENRSAMMYTRVSQAARWFDEKSAGLWRDPELETGLRWRREAQPTEAWARRYDDNFEPAMQFLDRSAEERDRVRAAEERARKRKLREYQWAAGVLGFLLVVTLWFFHTARVQKARAETYLGLAQQSVNEMLSSAGRQQARVAADVPELEAFRKELLEKARVFYSTFEQREPSNDQIRTEMAEAHFRLGDINRLLENRDEAAKQYQQAIVQFTALVKKHSQDPALRQWLANSYNWLGETLRVIPAQHIEAAEAYNQAAALQQALVHEDSNKAIYQRELARTYYNRGILSYADHQLQPAADDFGHAVELLEPLARNNSSPAAGQELARAYNDLANVLRYQDRNAEAEPIFEKAVAIDQGLSAQYPDNREYKFELANYYYNLALLSIDENKPDPARKWNGLALGLLTELSRPAPSLSMELVKTYNLAAQAEQTPAAIEAECQKARETLEQLAKNKSFQGRPELQSLYRDLGYNYLQLAYVQLQVHSVADAERALEQCSRILPEVSETDRGALNELHSKIEKKLHSTTSQK
jgi:tetratricopeptide (TPR) repeat protein/energy-coupling factor transporter ATP-binding protein EcfA2